jgi:hypothetical protein
MNMGNSLRWDVACVFTAWFWFSVTARADEAVMMTEVFVPGYRYCVRSSADLAGTLSVPIDKSKRKPMPVNITGASDIEYVERVLSVNSFGEVTKILRKYSRAELHRRVSGRDEESTIRPSVRRIAMVLDGRKVPFSPDGPLTWGEIDLVRTDVSTSSLIGLLPAQPVHTGDKWIAKVPVIREITDMDQVAECSVQCCLEKLFLSEKSRRARVTFAGKIRGSNENGPSVQELQGHLDFDLDYRCVRNLYIKGINSIIGPDGQSLSRVEGHFALTRWPGRLDGELNDETINGIALDPNSNNTRVLFENQELGARFLYPRRWRLVGVYGNQIDLDEPGGAGLRVTIDTSHRPQTAQQFMADTLAFFEKQKIRVLSANGPHVVPGASEGLERFTIEIVSRGAPVWMEYYALRESAGGATLAARLLPAELEALRHQVDQIARTVTIVQRK